MATALKKGESGGDKFKMYRNGASLAAQWIRLCLPMQGVWIQSLVGKSYPTYLAAKKLKNINQKQYCDKFN